MLEGKPLERRLISKSQNLMEPFIAKYAKKTKKDLINQAQRYYRRLQIILFQFPRLSLEEIEDIRKFVIILQILSRILKKTFTMPKFSFSWEDAIENLLHLEKDPNFMIKAILRERKRRVSYKNHLLWERDSIQHFKYNFFKPLTRQKTLLEYLSSKEGKKNDDE